MVERASNGFKAETYTWENIQANKSNPEHLKTLVNDIWSVCKDAGGPEATLANASLYFYVLSRTRNFVFESLEGGQAIAETFRTKNDKTRVFYEAKKAPGSRDLILAHLKHFVASQFPTGAKECRVVLPSEFFPDLDDVKAIFEDKWSMKRPNEVWRIYANADDFTANHVAKPEGYEEELLESQSRHELLQFFEDHYRRFPNSPRHSFDPNRLGSNFYLSLREAYGEKRRAAIAGEVGDVELNSQYAKEVWGLRNRISRVAILGDLVKADWVLDPNVPRYVAFKVAQNAFLPGPLRAPAGLIVADMINRASRNLALNLNTRMPVSKPSKLYIDAERIKKS